MSLNGVRVTGAALFLAAAGVLSVFGAGASLRFTAGFRAFVIVGSVLGLFAGKILMIGPNWGTGCSSGRPEAFGMKKNSRPSIILNPAGVRGSPCLPDR